MIFAGAGFSGDEQRGGRRRDFFRNSQQALGRRVGGNPWKTLRHG
jgi:hypothetical protein